MLTSAKTIIYSLIVSFFIIFFFDFFHIEHLNRISLILIVNLGFLLCVQQLYSIVCIVMHKTRYLAASITILTILLLTTYSNYFRRVTDVNWLYLISEFAVIKYVINSNVIAVYGLGRCTPGQIIQN